jgi:hypothetical protein
MKTSLVVKVPCAVLFLILMATTIQVGAQVVLETIDVRDTFIRPNVSPNNYTPPNNSSGPDSTGESDSSGGTERTKRCNNLKAAYAILSCRQKDFNGPANVGDLRIPGRYGNTLLWEGAALAFAQDLFNNYPINSRVAAANAARAALTSCAGVVSCQNDVLLYFGINRSSIGPLGTLGDINTAYNDFLRVMGLGGTLEGSDAGGIINRYYGLTYCQGLQSLASNAQNRCGAL